MKKVFLIGLFLIGGITDSLAQISAGIDLLAETLWRHC
jgi:hypothetical protein